MTRTSPCRLIIRLLFCHIGGGGSLMRLMNGCCLIKLGRLVVHQYFSLLLCICYFFYYSKLTMSACNRTLVLSYGQCGISNVQKHQSSVSLVDCVNLRLVRNWVWIIILLVRHSMSLISILDI